MATTMTRDDLVARLGIGALEESQQNAVLQTVANSVATRIWRKVAEALSDDDLEKLNHLVDAGKDEEAEDYIMSKFPDYDKFKAETEDEVIQEIIKNQKHAEEVYQQLKQQRVDSSSAG